jgi:hypothetical protein
LWEKRLEHLLSSSSEREQRWQWQIANETTTGKISEFGFVSFAMSASRFDSTL